MPAGDIGCCGAYCKACRVFLQGACRGCKTGYAAGERELRKAKCGMKVCCIGKGHRTCSDCSSYPSCATLLEFYQKNGYKYRKYRQATAYIRKHGYAAFLALAGGWKGAYGKYPEDPVPAPVCDPRPPAP